MAAGIGSGPGALASLGLRGDRLLFKEKETRPRGRRAEEGAVYVCVVRGRACVYTREYACASLATHVFPFHLGEPWGLRLRNIFKGTVRLRAVPRDV